MPGGQYLYIKKNYFSLIKKIIFNAYGGIFSQFETHHSSDKVPLIKNKL